MCLGLVGSDCTRVAEGPRSDDERALQKGGGLFWQPSRPGKHLLGWKDDRLDICFIGGKGLRWWLDIHVEVPGRHLGVVLGMEMKDDQEEMQAASIRWCQFESMSIWRKQ